MQRHLSNIKGIPIARCGTHPTLTLLQICLPARAAASQACSHKGIQPDTLEATATAICF